MDNLSTGLRIWNIIQCHILTGFILCKNMVRSKRFKNAVEFNFSCEKRLKNANSFFFVCFDLWSRNDMFLYFSPYLNTRLAERINYV